MEKVEQDREKHGMEMNIITQEGARCRRKGNLFCPLCNQCVTVWGVISTSVFSCNVAYNIWMKVLLLDWFWIVSANGSWISFLGKHMGCARGKKMKKVWRVIWLPVISSIWFARNDIIIFNNKHLGVEELLDLIKWCHGTGSRKSAEKFHCSFYDWSFQPNICLKQL